MTARLLGSDELIELGSPSGGQSRTVAVSHVRSVVDAWTRAHSERLSRIGETAERLVGRGSDRAFLAWARSLGSTTRDGSLLPLSLGERYEAARLAAWDLLGAAQDLERRMGPWLSGAEEREISMGYDRAIGLVDWTAERATPVGARNLSIVRDLRSLASSELRDTSEALGRLVGRVDLAAQAPPPPPGPAAHPLLGILIGAGAATAVGVLLPPFLRSLK